MLPIPKVVKTNDYVTDLVGAIDILTFKSISKTVPKIVLKSTHDFYTQYFEPTMIKEYFEGWDSVDGTDVIFYHKDTGDYRLRCNKYENERNIFVNIINHKDNFMNVRETATLQDFISDCLRAKIKLMWRD